MSADDHDVTELGRVVLFSGRVIRFEQSTRRSGGKSHFRIVSVKHAAEVHDFSINIPHHFIAELRDAINLFEQRALEQQRRLRRERDTQERQDATDHKFANLRKVRSRYR